jgi:hypothetical protein
MVFIPSNHETTNIFKVPDVPKAAVPERKVPEAIPPKPESPPPEGKVKAVHIREINNCYFHEKFVYKNQKIIHKNLTI